ncbi:MAG: HAD-IA family hydrolase [Actinomycetota bacterium]
MAAPAIDLLLTDLDGVVRHFDRSVADTLEVTHGLEVGSLRREAFEHPRGQAAITGGLTRSAWADEVGAAVGSPEAAHAWLGTWGAADPVMADLIRTVRAAGVPVAVLTNGTDTIHDELATVGLDAAFDHVFCTWFIGLAKPDPRVFAHVCASLDVQPARVLFVDDSPGNVDGARDAGLLGRNFAGVEDLRSALTDLGVSVG